MAEPPEAKKPHTLADHLLGEDADHSHPQGDFDHDHDHDDLAGYDPATDPLRLQDQLSLLSVGIDIGSSGTQVIFSRVDLRRISELLTSRYFVVNRERVYQSPVALTPYQSETRIDERAVGAIIDAAYGEARIHPDQIDTGVVILTGEALRRENAQAIGEVLAEIAGEFVCATAGPHMEALLAAYGSGAAKVSYDLGRPVLNVDIGGGTTKVALVEGGRVVHTAALDIGGRLAVVKDGRVIRLDPAGRRLAANAGLEWSLGAAAGERDLEQITEWMADALIAALTETETPDSVDALWLTERVEPVEGIAGVMFSGGVAEYVYGREQRDFGDLGRLLGAAIRKRLERGALPYPLLPAGECIRATAMGASEYTVQLSGNTVYISNAGALLPRKNLQVLQPEVTLAEVIDPARVADSIRHHLEAFDLPEGESDVALAFRWSGAPSYERLSALARGIVDALPNTLRQGRPIYLVVDGDVAHSLGALMKEEWGVGPELLVIDGVALWDFDYIDLGRVRMPSHTVPVTIKSLVFGEDPRARIAAREGARDPGHVHDPPHPQGHHHRHRHTQRGRASK
jgi:ethanolamine utilization protein EutA